ncbi:hypothetical protein [Streptomyces zagrosensis]|uniref:Uncharacterized protein n=1 Tax=Streptomyces zagrosensis TaxID=1042984 RepID=A0A7W9QCE6_9ACTN|nr:hypothetical protein [Streptomyces zagrosensis]MBB5937551.1 hypothetical protein [Streptomyces zagrosensis]
MKIVIKRHQYGKPECTAHLLHCIEQPGCRPRFVSGNTANSGDSDGEDEGDEVQTYAEAEADHRAHGCFRRTNCRA